MSTPKLPPSPGPAPAVVLFDEPVLFTGSVEEVLAHLHATERGLSDREAAVRRQDYGPNEPAKRKQLSPVLEFLARFLNPLVIVLLIIGGFSLAFGDPVSAVIVSVMAVASVIISFVQEHRAHIEAVKLARMVSATTAVLRNGKLREVPLRDLVPGDIVDLAAGDMIPADLRVLSGKDLTLNEAALTGESLPVEKTAAPIQLKKRSLSELTNIAFLGSSVVSGTGTGLVVRTGAATQFGEIARDLTAEPPQTSFDRGITRFTWLMVRLMLVLVVVIFAINALLRGHVVEAFLFSLGVAVGLTPEMLPLIVALNLSKGAIAMSRKRVIVKHLTSMQNFGAMDVLCTDKTGTLTQDQVVLERYCDVVREESLDVLRFAYLNSSYQTGLRNLLDRAILKHEKLDLPEYKKTDEIPFDFTRRIMSVVVEREGKQTLIAKGAPEEIYKRCTHYELDGEILEMESLILSDLKAEYDHLGADGFRVLAIAYKPFPTPKPVYSQADEAGLILKGYVAFLDPPKATTHRALEALARLGIKVKVLTGDNDLVARKICGDVGLDVSEIVTGDRLEGLAEPELRALVERATVFARLAPLQKEKVVRALHDQGHTVGFLGDGINDAPALKAADVGISVNNAVDIAKESADMILLKKSLMVLQDGVLEGRKTFGNILKYVQMGASSNFGNMFSMTGGSLLLPFLPMLPIQILLNNFLYDFSQTAIPTDNVDADDLRRPRPWDIQRIQRFMLIIGPVSSIFDFLTFGVLLYWFRAGAVLFHTGWFVESLVTQSLVIHVIRTNKVPWLQSRASRFLTAMSFLVAALAVYLPLSPLARYLGFTPPPPAFYLFLAGVTVAYLGLVQGVKVWFNAKFHYDERPVSQSSALKKLPSPAKAE